MSKLCWIKTTFLIAAALLYACTDKPVAEPSFYFWRTTASLSATEKKALTDLHIHTLYTRFFDVDVPAENADPQPLGVIDSLELLPENLLLTPVVYITNRTFTRIKTETGIMDLADKVAKKINGLYSGYKELQIDCDWTETTRSRYFLFLTVLKKQLPAGVKLTSTIRLHQIKYPEKTGIPPVDGGMLMFYNIGNLKDSNGPNSIFDAKTAAAYTAYIKRYQLHLDAALPVFRWFVHYRNGNVKGLITKKQLPEVTDTSYFRALDGRTYFTVKHPALIHGVSYEKDDVLKYEGLTEEELIEAAKLLQQHLYEEPRTIILYDLDEINIKYYETNAFQNLYAVFH